MHLGTGQFLAVAGLWLALPFPSFLLPHLCPVPTVSDSSAQKLVKESPEHGQAWPGSEEACPPPGFGGASSRCHQALQTLGSQEAAQMGPRAVEPSAL